MTKLTRTTNKLKSCLNCGWHGHKWQCKKGDVMFYKGSNVPVHFRLCPNCETALLKNQNLN